MTISTTRIRNADGTWGGWITTVTEPAPTTESTVTYEIVDRTDPQAIAAWNRTASDADPT